ncbi:hypothetical protein FGE12_08400 [Aggregicoccus sp. 17bor-14]|uniref:hypothetical protein n=1 Tax=Myxococcaceae TaxID=31 RepID=UPI00129C3AE2|nr:MULTISPECIES: hypothetical protein [Myxococcaceae]MBF5042418.1 hypothetical protein [Simulacricoccus sp. 17bor-14]MRI88190.1 hypothetical protein [Aggregicoccus sp. 17bor-14]
MKTSPLPRSFRLVALLLLGAHGSAWAQDAAAPAAQPATPAATEPAPAASTEPAAAAASDAPVQAPAATPPAPATGLPQYTPRPMTRAQRELQRRLSLRHYALMGTSLVLTGGGLYFGAKSKGSLNRAHAAQTQIAAQDALKSSREQARAANWAFIGAGTAVVAAVVTYFISPPTPPPEEPGSSPYSGSLYGVSR